MKYNLLWFAIVMIMNLHYILNKDDEEIIEHTPETLTFLEEITESMVV